MGRIWRVARLLRICWTQALGKIEQIEVGSVGEPEAALFTFDRNAGVVADALMQPRQGVKKGRLPRVRVPDDPNQWRFFIRLDVC